MQRVEGPSFRFQLTWLTHSFSVGEEELKAHLAKYFSEWVQPAEIVFARPALWIERFTPFGQYVRSTRTIRLFSLRDCVKCGGKAYVLRSGVLSEPKYMSKNVARDLYLYDVVPHEFSHLADHLKQGDGFRGGRQAEVSATVGAKRWRMQHGFPERPWYASAHLEEDVV